MLRMEFLYLGALIAIAAAIQGNMMATWLAVMAFALTFIVIRPAPSSSSSPPHEVRGEKKMRNKLSRSLVNNHGEQRMSIFSRKRDVDPEEIATQCHETIISMVQAAIMASGGAGKDGPRMRDGTGPQASYVGGMAALGALVPLAMIVGKMPDDVSKDEIDSMSLDDQRVLAHSLIMPETLTYAALMSARMQTTMNSQTGRVSIEFGPHVLWAALVDWEKVFPDKKAEDFLAPPMVQAARDFGANPKIPNHVIAGRDEVKFGSPRTLQ